jgi:hippurate hydrolase
MNRSALAFLAASILAAPASAATLNESIRADMPQLMTLYRDLHSNPELSMQEVRTPAKLAGDAQAWLYRHRACRQNRRRVGAEERRWPDPC